MAEPNLTNGTTQLTEVGIDPRRSKICMDCQANGWSNNNKTTADVALKEAKTFRPEKCDHRENCDEDFVDLILDRTQGGDYDT